MCLGTERRGWDRTECCAQRNLLISSLLEIHSGAAASEQGVNLALPLIRLLPGGTLVIHYSRRYRWLSASPVG